MTNDYVPDENDLFAAYVHLIRSSERERGLGPVPNVKIQENFAQGMAKIKSDAKVEALSDASKLADSHWTGTTSLPDLVDPDVAYSFDVWLEHLAYLERRKENHGEE